MTLGKYIASNLEASGRKVFPMEKKSLSNRIFCLDYNLLHISSNCGIFIKKTIVCRTFLQRFISLGIFTEQSSKAKSSICSKPHNTVHFWYINFSLPRYCDTDLSLDFYLLVARPKRLVSFHATLKEIVTAEPLQKWDGKV